MKLTEKEEIKLSSLRRIVSVKVINEKDGFPLVILSGCYKFVGLTVEECLDRLFVYLEESGFRNDKDIKQDYNYNLVKLKFK